MRLLKTLAAAVMPYFKGNRTTTANPFGAYKLLRTTSAVVLVTFTSVILSPAIAAIRADAARTEREDAAKPGALEQYAIDLKRLGAAVKGDKIGAAIGAQTDRSWFGGKPGNDVRTVLTKLTDAGNAIDTEFGRTEAHLKARNLAPVILQRHEDTVRAFRAKHAELQQLAAAVAKRGGDDAALADSTEGRQLKTFLAQNAVKSTPADFKNLPWRVHAAKARKPIEDAAALRAVLDQPTAASTASTASNNTKQKGNASGEATNTKAAAGPPPATNAPAATLTPPAPPAPADLAETIDVQLTPAIRAKAAELNNHPLTIYQWVKNNVRYFPSYGSVQGAQDTLDKLSGNDFDTASLLIALYRAAGIPARYVYGTIDLPAAAAMNWVGGVTKPEAAQQILGQGGVPNTALTSAGQISQLRIEHVWVEAWITYGPARGAKHTTGQGDTWVPVDASYKQYSFTQGMDLKAGVPFDANAFLTQAQQGATVNQAEGWVQNLNQTNIQNQLTAYQNQVQSYVNAQKPNATVGDVLGTQTIVPDTKAILAGLPYKVVTTANRYAALPSNLRHQFQYNLYTDAASRGLDSPVWTYQQSLPQLAGKKITLSYSPATQADADLIASYLPKPHADGSPIQASEFPASIPAYAKVKAQLRVEGQIVAEGGIFTLGQELAGKGGFTTYDLTGWDLTDDETLVAGQATAIGVSVQGVSGRQLGDLKTRMEQTKVILEALQGQANPSTPALFDDDRLTGDLLTATIWGYFGGVQTHGEIARRQSGMADRPGLSYGLFHAKAQPVRPFGIVTTAVKFPGVEMDIGHLRHLRWANNNEQSGWIAYNRMRGQAASALEHATPERFFVDSAACNAPEATAISTPPYDSHKPACAEAVSSAKAIAVAQAQGQKIFTITSTNVAVVLPQLNHSQETKTDIQNAVSAGKEVSIHEARLSFSGWTGAGYIIVDPATGAGSYLIEGKANGGWFSLVANAFGALSIMSLLFGKLALAGLIPALAIAAPYYALVLGAFALTAALITLFEGGYDRGCDGCSTIHIILKIVAGVTALLLLSAGFAGGLIALVLAILLMKQITGGGP